MTYYYSGVHIVALHLLYPVSRVFWPSLRSRGDLGGQNTNYDLHV